GRTGQEHVGVLGGFVQEQILHYHTLHGGHGGGHVLGVRVGLNNVLALAVQPLEAATQGGVKHIGNAQAGFGLQGHAPGLFKLLTYAVVGDVTVARELVREGAHIAGALHVVLTTQGVHTHAFAAHVAGCHGQVGNRHHGGGTLAVFSHAQTVVNRAVAAGGVQTGCATDVVGRYTADLGHGFWRVLGLADKAAPFIEGSGIAALGHIGLVHQIFGDDDVGHGGQHGGVGAWTQGQVV